MKAGGEQGPAGIPVDTLIFDIDDTLYASSSGFSAHRNEDVVIRFMREKLQFQSDDEAKTLWRKYMSKYHSTMKGLTVASEEGVLPVPFKQEELGVYWAEHCDFPRYLQPETGFVEALRSLREEAGLNLVAFTNAPRAYGLRCLEHLGLAPLFPPERVFAVEDVLPACKPEKAAFEQVLGAVGTAPERCVMFEDSMKNVRACKALGMGTVLIMEKLANETQGEASQINDTPVPTDPSVDVVLRRIGELPKALPGLWQGRFEPTPREVPS